MALCIEEYDKDTNKRYDALVKVTNRVLHEKGEEADFIRASIGLHHRQTGLGKGALEGAYKQWVRSLVGIDIRAHSELPQMSDIAQLNATIDVAHKKYREARDFGEKMIKRYGTLEKAVKNEVVKEQLIGKFRQAMPVTKRVHYYEKLPNGFVYDNIVMIKQRSDVKRERAQQDVNEIVMEVLAISGERNDREIRKLGEVDQKIGDLNDKLAIYRQMKQDGKLTHEFRVKMKSTQHDLDLALVKKGTLQADFEAHPTTALMSSMVSIIEATDPMKKSSMIKKLASNMLTDIAPIVELEGNIRAMFDPFIGMANETTSKAKELVEMHLERLGVPKVERVEFVDSIFNFKAIEEGYFPRIYVSIKDGMFFQDVVNKLSEVTIAEKEIVKDTMREMVSNFTKHREADFEMSGRNRNVIDVLLKYSQQMLHSNLVTNVAHELETQIQTIWDIGQKYGNRGMDLYLEAYKNELGVLRRDTIGTADHGINASLSRTANALWSVAKLGMLNIGGWARNAGEGSAMLVSAVGLGGLRRAHQVRKEHGAIIEEFTQGEKVDLSVQRFWDDQNMPMETRQIYIDKYGPQLMEKMFGVKAEHSEQTNRFVAALEKGSSKLAQNLLKIGWSPVENFMRSTAHKTGSALGFHEAETYYKPLFRTNRITESIIKEFGLDPEVVSNPDPKVYLGEGGYRTLAKELTNRTGFEIMGKTQWVYDKMERHAVEGWAPGGFQVGKSALMFQHYGFSWNSAMYLAFSRMAGRVKAGGLKEGLTGTTKEAQFSLFEGAAFNRDAVYLSAMMGAILGGLFAEDRSGLGKMVGLRVYGAFNNNVVDFFKGIHELANDETREYAFFGKGAISTMTGPPIQDLMNVLNIGLVHYGATNEEWPEWLADGLRNTIGFAPNQDDANYDLNNKVESLLTHLQRTTPLTSKGIPAVQAAFEGNGSEFLKMIARYGFNVAVQYNPKETEERTAEELEHEANIRKRERLLRASETSGAQ